MVRTVRLSEKHALVGITFLAIESLSKEQCPPRLLLLQWLARTEQIKSHNILLNRRAVEVRSIFNEFGYDNVLLKGQGIAQLYPSPLYRQSGDIDIWLGADMKHTLNVVRKFDNNSNPVYHNVSCHIFNDALVEVHFRPSWMNNPFTNHKLQQYFQSEFARQALNTTAIGDDCMVSTPTLDFNRIFILVHIYRHLFSEGVGLRQLLDYYYVLHKVFSEEERVSTLHVLKQLKMLRFTAGIMYVLHIVFQLDDRFLLCTPNEQDGKMLLSEILITGNFGHYDPRIIRDVEPGSIASFTHRVLRNFRFVRYYPSEAIWTSYFKIWHFFWRHKYQ